MIGHTLVIPYLLSTTQTYTHIHTQTHTHTHTPGRDTKQKLLLLHLLYLPVTITRHQQPTRSHHDGEIAIYVGIGDIWVTLCSYLYTYSYTMNKRVLDHHTFQKLTIHTILILILILIKSCPAAEIKLIACIYFFFFQNINYITITKLKMHIGIRHNYNYTIDNTIRHIIWISYYYSVERENKYRRYFVTYLKTT